MTNIASSIPDVIAEHITNHSIKKLEPAWIQVEPNTETIKTLGGAWFQYFETQPIVGSPVSSLCEMLMGMLPTIEHFELPQIQLSEDKYTNISILHDVKGDWILFCDVTQNTLQLQQYQQTSNELTLIKGQLKRTLDRYVGQEVYERVSKGSLQFDTAGERKNITTLFVDIRGFTPFNETHDAQVVIHTLNDYMSCMLKPILEEFGMVDKIMGDGVMAVFGVLPSSNNSAHDARSAANKILQRTLLLNQHRKSQQLEQLGIGIGFATGDAVLGLLGSHERRTFTAIGRHVNLAARLESNARIGEILIDTESFNQLEKPDSFTPATLSLKGIGKTDVYTHIQKCID
ncbi:MAG: adenylate/guanylate cyclase domain-containing protein [Ghiorsea sp.]